MNVLGIPDKDLPLRDDIRLLGRVLGDTVRGAKGEVVFEFIEHVRQTSIRFHRDEDQSARRELERILNGLPPRQTIEVHNSNGECGLDQIRRR
jgi:phosphoenolpyruvate carboxylase